jgi:hypothetical protein
MSSALWKDKAVNLRVIYILLVLEDFLAGASHYTNIVFRLCNRKSMETQGFLIYKRNGAPSIIQIAECFDVLSLLYNRQK